MSDQTTVIYAQGLWARLGCRQVRRITLIVSYESEDKPGLAAAIGKQAIGRLFRGILC